MASLFANADNAFPRSHSSSNLPDFVSLEFKHSQPAIKTDELPRSASYTYLPLFEGLSYASDNDPLRDLAATVGQAVSAKNDKSNHKPGENDERSRLGRTKSLVARPKSWIQRAVRGSPERRALAEYKTPAEIPPVPIIKTVPDKSRNAPESFATFARKTWISSRSPSPSNRTKKKDPGHSILDEDDSTAASSIKSSSTRKSLIVPLQLEDSTSNTSSTAPSKGPTGNLTLLHKKSKRPLSEIANAVDLNSASTSNSSLPGSLSDKEGSSRGSTEAPPLPKTFGKDKLTSLVVETPRQKDELWSAFRSLDSDYQKFQAKASALRPNVVRSNLLPFLKNSAHHVSNKTLRPEDIDRRVAILSKWWAGLLEMLESRNNQYISGIDRPVILDAITGIMTRPEWRLAPSYFAPIADRAPLRSFSHSRSSGSLNSSASQFLAESVYHNVRNIFIQNLLSQMNLVVDKMSLRNAPASLVTFCGKAAAYAFFFCPGLADILVRVWAIPSETIRRVVDEFALVRGSNSRNGVDGIVADFPPNLHSLGWKSSKALIAQLRQRLNMPLAASKIPWHGPWVARWCGRDSDLFFVFCKHYHILCEEFLPSDAPLSEKARAPGFVLVHAQILTSLDATIHRQPSGDAAAIALINFDDILSGADASAAALPLPPSSNVARLMAENRLIMLLRDFLSERSSGYQTARLTFAEAFSSTMRAAARKTSQFDHSACFIMCDFMEEALTIYMRFQNALEEYVEYVEWVFWFSVCQKMLESQNSMTEIRLFAFIFGAWNMIVGDERRKEVLCFEWLLSDNIFQKYYLHWCPMVRAYYMRLLCWRVCRFDGEASQMDIKIWSTVSDCLKLVWSHYLYQSQAGEKDYKLLPSIAPCQPAPGRRLLIIRNDNLIPTATAFLGFDGIVQASSGTQETAYRRTSTLANLVRSNSTNFNVAADPSVNSKKRWSLLSKIMPFNNPDSSGHGNNTTSPTTQKPISPLEQVRQATASARARPLLQVHTKPSSPTSSDSAPSTPTHKPLSFKFSLEWTPPHQDHLYPPYQTPKLASNSNNAALPPPRRLLAPRLPAATYALLVGKVPNTAHEVMPKKPTAPESKYAGRALAEWALVVKECNNFVERRKVEGVPGLKLMEVPTLGVDGFRKYC